MTVLLDSVILIDYLNAVPAARAYVDARYAGGGSGSVGRDDVRGPGGRR